jgi:hypothetical protein
LTVKLNLGHASHRVGSDRFVTVSRQTTPQRSATSSATMAYNRESELGVVDVIDTVKEDTRTKGHKVLWLRAI